jgi:hypothetical protein
MGVLKDTSATQRLLCTGQGFADTGVRELPGSPTGFLDE